ncbi:hypothetical protein [Duncaniella muris]|uniref:hypothetical protein n=2 Tax=Bacteroidales TaxID=171549 RepID=UPI0025B6DA86|nr:hypothetical protein [Duncaniella muris]
MKYIQLIILAIVGLLFSCNKESEPPLYLVIPIVNELEPQSKIINWGEMTAEEKRQYPLRGFVINSYEDFPNEENLEMKDLQLLDIDFSKYTLLVQYKRIPGIIKSHHYCWMFDNGMERYEFQASFNIVRFDADNDPNEDLFTYYRAAIIVNKIMPDKEVVFTTSY